MNPSKYIEVKYPVVCYSGFSITHGICLPVTFGDGSCLIILNILNSQSEENTVYEYVKGLHP